MLNVAAVVILALKQQNIGATRAAAQSKFSFWLHFKNFLTKFLILALKQQRTLEQPEQQRKASFLFGYILKTFLQNSNLKIELNIY